MVRYSGALPSVEPEYRERRSHSVFMTNIDVSREGLVAALRQAWNPQSQMEDIPESRIATLCRDKYDAREWTYRR